MGTALIHNRVIRQAQGGLPEFTYTGEYSLINEGEGDWKIRFLTSGTLTLKNACDVDIFLVGGGGGGGKYTYGGGGGGGGYTATKKNVTLEKGTEYAVTIGAGGAVNSAGGQSSFADIVFADGGSAGVNSGGSGGGGGSGGSGGGSGSYSSAGGDGGSDGSDGFIGSGVVGKGQGTTTREFGEDSSRNSYAGGGGGASGSNSGKGGAGGDGGGGTGGAGNLTRATAGEDNRGGGGGGASSTNAGMGGSGIVIIRNAREAA